MNATRREMILQRWNVVQHELLPELKNEVGALTPKLERVIHTLEWVRIEQFVSASWCGTGRPPHERSWLANAFVAKAVLGLTSTVGLIERLTVDIPDEFVGVVTQLMGLRRGQMEQMVNHGTGWVRLQFTVPSRGLIGFRTALLSATRGTGIASSISAGYAPWAGQIVTRQNGSMVCDRQGVATPYAMQRLQARGNFFVEPQSPVYEGQVVGINNKPDELDVNITLAKHMTNMRSATADVLETLTPPIKMSLEESLDFANEDECVEVTPESIRVRKIILSREDWYKWRAKQRRQNNAQNNK